VALRRTEVLAGLHGVRDALRGFASAEALRLVEGLIARVTGDGHSPEAGIVPETLRAVARISERLGRGPTRAELAEELFLDAHSIDYRVQRLRAAGLIAQAQPVGRRGTLVLTDAGRRRLLGGEAS